MALSPETEAQMLAYVYGELDADAARAFEDLLARDPALRAEVDGLLAVAQILERDDVYGVSSGEDAPPPHLFDAILRAEALSRPADVKAAMARAVEAPKPPLVSRLTTWLMGGGAAVAVAATFVFLVVAKGDRQSPDELLADGIAEAPSAAAATPPAEPMAADDAPAKGMADGRAKLDAMAPAAEPASVEEARPAEAQQFDPASPGGRGQAMPAKPSDLMTASGGGGALADAERDDGAQLGRAAKNEAPRESFGDAAGEKRPMPEGFEKRAARKDQPAPDDGPADLAEAEASIDAPGRLEAKAVAKKSGKAKPEPVAQTTTPSTTAAPSSIAIGTMGVDADDEDRAGASAPRARDKAKERKSEEAKPQRAAPPPPAPSSGPPPLSKEEGEYLRSLRSESRALSPKQKLVEDAKKARRELDAEVMLATANSEMVKGQPASALGLYNEAAALDPGGKTLGILPVVGKMRALIALGRPAEALGLVGKVKAAGKKADGYAEGMIQAGEAALALGQLRDAEGYFTAARALAGARGRADEGLARVKRARAADAEPAAAAEPVQE